MIRQRTIWILPLLGACCLAAAAPLLGDDSQPANGRLAAPASAAQIVARFDQRQPDWQVRMRSLVEIARLGPAAVSDLVAALATGSPGAREFAAQALAMFDGPAARQTLDEKLADPAQPAPVRIYAIKALRMLGPLTPDEAYQNYVVDPERGVRGTMSGALEWKGEVDAAGVRRQLAEYELSKLASAQVGQLAPDFELATFAGEQVRLSDFRGKQHVVLRYFKLDY